MYKKQKKVLTLLKLIAQSKESLIKGRYKSLKKSFRSIRKKVRKIVNQKQSGVIEDNNIIKIHKKVGNAGEIEKIF